MTRTGSSRKRPPAGGFHAAVIGVADMAQARQLWEDTFGLQAVPGSEGALPALVKRWGLEEAALRETVCLHTPGTVGGQLRLVSFNAPAAPVRAGARAFDLCPKNIDVYVDDLPARLPALRAAGFHFRNEEYSEVTAPNGVRFREIHMHGHDHINIVLLELLDEPLHFSAAGFAAIGALVTIVPDPPAEARFYEQHFALTPVAQHRLGGPEIEAMIGLPPGAGLDITIMGTPGNLMGQLEIIAYRGVEGENLYPLTSPPATGIIEIEMIAEHIATVAGPAGHRAYSPAGLAIQRMQAACP